MSGGVAGEERRLSPYADLRSSPTVRERISPGNVHLVEFFWNCKGDKYASFFARFWGSVARIQLDDGVGPAGWSAVDIRR